MLMPCIVGPFLWLNACQKMPAMNFKIVADNQTAVRYPVLLGLLHLNCNIPTISGPIQGGVHVNLIYFGFSFHDDV